jgi:hypothetical protein
VDEHDRRHEGAEGIGAGQVGGVDVTDTSLALGGVIVGSTAINGTDVNASPYRSGRGHVSRRMSRAFRRR